MSFAVDANILLYASDSDSPYHKRAGAFLEDCIKRTELFCLSWPTVMSYLRIATHPSVFDRPLTPYDAMANVETLLNLPHTRFLSEEEGFWDIYRELTAAVPTRGNLVPDAHLAAILRQHGVKKFYTHDRDFLKFAFLDVHDPLV
jgi:toxin-antitoxin system PIN domain toxin